MFYIITSEDIYIFKYYEVNYTIAITHFIDIFIKSTRHIVVLHDLQASVYLYYNLYNS